MAVIILIGLGLVLALCPTIRCAFFHPVKLVRYGAVDLFQYLKYHKWNECRTGELVAYVGLFSPLSIRWSPCTSSTTVSRSGIRTGPCG